MKRMFIMSAVCAVLSSCGPKVFSPLYTTTQSITPAPAVTYLALRDVPEVERDQLVISLFKEIKLNENDYFNNPGASKSANGQAPSVVISVPAGTKKNQQSESELYASTRNEFGSSGVKAGYKSDGHYNEAEQAVEASLLRQGFDVMDRAKFEAKLRDMRDKANEVPVWYNSYHRLIENEDFDALKSLLSEELKEGKMSQDTYIQRMQEVDKLSQEGLPGKNREKDEMNDIAEVIRAAHTGEDQAEYLLQINGVSVSDAGNRTFTIKDLSVVQQFMDNNPGLRFGSTPYALPSSIQSNWLRSDFNAKLISIETGSIVWLGSHEIESWSAEPIEITFEVKKRVDNHSEINGAIKDHNNKLELLSNKLTSKTNSLQRAYDKAYQSTEFENQELYEKYKEKLQGEIQTLERERSDIENALTSAMNKKPYELNAPWTYSYEVSDPIISPDLISDELSIDAVDQQRFRRHKQEMIRTVTRQLIQSIEIKE